MNRKICWLWVMLLAAMLSQLVMAQNGEPLLPGSVSKIDKAVSRADTIVVAKLLSLGITSPDALGQADYDSAQLQVISTLKGTPNQNLTVSISVHHSKGIIEEVAPEEAKTYLFFIRTDDAKRQIAVKILPATDDNITKVKTLIAAAPTGK